ncbi:uncharacterized protein [Dermacentor albipictus]|uniref:uncharacterized protein isoform X1 n=1 Tax=Dermacentor albipictus TaxID=60249 RepID=UPI0038FC7258
MSPLRATYKRRNLRICHRRSSRSSRILDLKCCNRVRCKCRKRLQTEVRHGCLIGHRLIFVALRKIPKNEARFQRRVLACELPQGCHQGLTCQAAHNRWHIRMIAQHQGYVKVNWSRLNKDLQQAQNELARRTDGKLPRLLEEAQKFVKDNVFLATGFAGGFLLGVASS